MSYPIATIEGIGPVYADKLKKAGIRTTAALLARAKDPKGRKEVAAAADIDDGLILKWANMADLMRIKGVGEEYSELLEAAGVDTVKELRTRNAANLTKAMVEANAKRKMVRLLPSLSAVTKWVEQAKTLPPMMTY
jgi:predicted flap endonuclease-1-like 5' DNA nuclease